MKVGVTGGAGFIGSWLTTELLGRGHEVVCFDRLGKAPPGAISFLGDVRDATAVTELAAAVDGIVHLAAVLGTAETILNPRPAAETNILGSLNVFEAAAQYGLPVVNAAVGNARIGRGTYCVTKTCAEDFVPMYVHDRGQRFVSVRPMNAYGPGQKAPAPWGSSKVRKIIPTFVCAGLTGQDVTLYGAGAQVSDCVFVGDVARVMAAALEHAAGSDLLADRPIEVGPLQSHTVREVAEIVCQHANGGRLVDLPMRPGEPTGAIVRADPSTLAPLGIDPAGFVALEDGIGMTVEWFAANEGVTWHS